MKNPDPPNGSLWYRCEHGHRHAIATLAELAAALRWRGCPERPR